MNSLSFNQLFQHHIASAEIPYLYCSVVQWYRSKYTKEGAKRSSDYLSAHSIGNNENLA